MPVISNLKAFRISESHIQKLFKISETTFSDMGARVCTRLHFMSENVFLDMSAISEIKPVLPLKISFDARK